VRPAETQALQFGIAHPSVQNAIGCVDGEPPRKRQPSLLAEPVGELLAVELGVIDEIERVIEASRECEIHTTYNVVTVNPTRHIEAVALDEAASSTQERGWDVAAWPIDASKAQDADIHVLRAQ
jgi:hypothetical protein